MKCELFLTGHPYTEFIMADDSREPRHENMKARRMAINIFAWLGGKRGAGVRGTGSRGTGYGVRATGYGVPGYGVPGCGKRGEPFFSPKYEFSSVK